MSINKTICLLSGLLFSFASYAAPPVSVYFDQINNQWNQNGLALPNMGEMVDLVTFGKTSFGLGCQELSTCQTQYAKNGWSQIISVYNSALMKWSAPQSISDMQVIFNDDVLPDDAALGTSSAWVLGLRALNSPQYMISYFNGRQFSPAAPWPVNRISSNFKGYPFAVFNHKLWFFATESEHKAYWTSDTQWHELQSPGAPSDLAALARDNISQEIYLLGHNNIIYHLLPNETWAAPISIPSFPNLYYLTDMRVTNNGRIITVFALFNGSTGGTELHLLITQDNGRTWKDTGVSYGSIIAGFISVHNGNRLNLFWTFSSNGLRYFNPYDTNPSWQIATLPASLRPAKAINYKLTSSIDGDQVWLYGNAVNDQFVAFYYDLKFKKYIVTHLEGIADSISWLEPSVGGKAVAYGLYNSQPVGLYYDGVKWNSTPLALFNTSAANVKMSVLPYCSPVGNNYPAPIVPFKQMLDPAFNNVWLFNQQ